MRSTRFQVAFLVTVAAAAFATRTAVAQDNTAGRNSESEASLAPGTPIFADLNNSVDSKKAKAGDAVMAHTIEAVKSADARTILPRGTKLIGHVTEASARSKGDGQSALGLTFEKAILKDGSEIPLYARIQAMTTPVSFSSAGDDGPPRDTANMGTTQTSPMGGRSGPPAGTPPQTGLSGGAATGPDQAGPGLSPNSRGVIGMRGLTLSTALADKILVSTIASDGKNVHLDSGTRLLIVSQPPPAEPQRSE